MPIARDRYVRTFPLPGAVRARARTSTTAASRGRSPRASSAAATSVVVLPVGQDVDAVVSIDTFDGPLDEAFAPQSVTLRLADEIDVSRGDMIVREENVPRAVRRFDSILVWLSERPFDAQRALPAQAHHAYGARSCRTRAAPNQSRDARVGLGQGGPRSRSTTSRASRCGSTDRSSATPTRRTA